MINESETVGLLSLSAMGVGVMMPDTTGMVPTNIDDNLQDLTDSRYTYRVMVKVPVLWLPGISHALGGLSFANAGKLNGL